MPPVSAAGVGPDVAGSEPQELVDGSHGGIHVSVVGICSGVQKAAQGLVADGLIVQQGEVDEVVVHQGHVVVRMAVEHGKCSSKQKPAMLVITAGAWARSSHGALGTGSGDSVL